MKSLYLGSYFGIPVKVHSSFLLILVMIAYIAFTEEMTGKEALLFSSLIFLMFFSVLLHEYGHALMARRYNIKTVDIIMSPIGGLARMELPPLMPKKELMIALAGPMVNLFIAAMIYLIFRIMGLTGLSPDYEVVDLLDVMAHPIGYLELLAGINVVLFGFNLIPAFPMDGGRILRALLSLRLTRLKATGIAVMIGQSFAVGFMIYGALNQLWSLLLIGPVIFMMARREYDIVRR